MKAIALTRYLPIDDPQSLQDVELAKPVASGFDLLVRVEAVSVNPVDTKVRLRAASPDGQPRILGWDAAGIVRAAVRELSALDKENAAKYAAMYNGRVRVPLVWREPILPLRAVGAVGVLERDPQAQVRA